MWRTGTIAYCILELVLITLIDKLGHFLTERPQGNTLAYLRTVSSSQRSSCPVRGEHWPGLPLCHRSFCLTWQSHSPLLQGEGTWRKCKFAVSINESHSDTGSNCSLVKTLWVMSYHLPFWLLIIALTTQGISPSSKHCTQSCDQCHNLWCPKTALQNLLLFVVYVLVQ